MFFEALSNKGYVLNIMRKHKQAIEALDKAIQINPNNYWAWVGKGAAYSELGKLKDAVKSFNKAIEINPNDIAALHLKGIAFENFGEFEKALITFNQVIEINSSFAEAWCIKGSILKELKKFEEATNAFTEVIKIEPKDYRGWFIKGRALYSLGFFEETIQAYDKALSLNPDASEIKISKSWFLSTCPEKKFRNGTNAVEILQKIDDSKKHIYGVLAAAYAEIGDFPKAVYNQEKEFAFLKKNGKEKAIQRTDLKNRLELYKAKQVYRDNPVNFPSIK